MHVPHSQVSRFIFLSMRFSVCIFWCWCSSPFVLIFFYPTMQHKTIDSVMERGEKLDSLVDKSNDLSMASQVRWVHKPLCNGKLRTSQKSCNQDCWAVFSLECDSSNSKLPLDYFAGVLSTSQEKQSVLQISLKFKLWMRFIWATCIIIRVKC